MQMIYKYETGIADVVFLGMPVGAKVLSAAGFGYGGITIWAQVDPSAETEERAVYIRGTGHELGDMSGAEFVCTVRTHPFVWHVFA